MLPAFYLDLIAISQSSHSPVKAPCACRRVLPAFYSDNFITLAPREATAVALDWPAPLRNSMRLQVIGYNAGTQTLTLPAALAAS